MIALSIWSTFAAAPGREAELREVLDECLRLLRAEPGTTQTVLMQLDEGGWAVFNTFRDADALDAHVRGPVPTLLKERKDVLAGAPAIAQGKIVADQAGATAEDGAE